MHLSQTWMRILLHANRRLKDEGFRPIYKSRLEHDAEADIVRAIVSRLRAENSNHTRELLKQKCARVDDGEGEDDDGERVEVQREGVARDPAHQAHHRDGEDRNLRKHIDRG